MLHSKTLYEKGLLKNLKMLTQSQYSSFKFVGRLENIKTFAAGINALSFGEIGAFQITEDGFRVTVEEGKSVQASLFITPTWFSEFHVIGNVHFSLNLDILVDCLAIYASIDCGIKMFYKGESSPLIVVLEPHEEDNITTECSIKTTRNEDIMEYSLDENSASLNVVFIRGPELSNIFNEFDKSADELEITISQRKPHFKMSTLGVMQSEATVEVAKTSDMILLYTCRETTSARYKCSQMRHISKALSVASKVAIKTDATGLLEMHFMMLSEDQAEVYIQFFLTPLADLTL